MKFMFVVFVFFACATTAYAGDFCNDPRNAPTDFCESMRKSKEALDKVRELLEKSKQIQKEVDRQLDQKMRELQKK